MSITESLDIQREVELFLYREAKLLDAGNYDAWLDLFTEDAHYWMPITEVREVGQEREPIADEWSYIEDDKQFMRVRRQRLATTQAHAEQPRSRTRHFITNVLVTGEPEGPLVAECNILVFQSRSSEQFFVGRRKDTLVATDDGWKISNRLIVLDHRVLPRAISFFL